MALRVLGEQQQRRWGRRRMHWMAVEEKVVGRDVSGIGTSPPVWEPEKILQDF